MNFHQEHLSDVQHLTHVVEHASHVLPGQGPLSVFIHHNTLHAFEHLPFEEAVVQAGRIYGCQPFMHELWYRQELERGRIKEVDLASVLEAETPTETVGDCIPLLELRQALLHYPLHVVDGPALRWHLHETGALWRLRQEVATPVRERLRKSILEWLADRPEQMAERVGPLPDEWGRASLASTFQKQPEKLAVRALWSACRSLVANLDPARFPGPLPLRRTRLRDVAVGNGLGDIDSLVHPFLIRFTAAYLDQGQADLLMPGRKEGYFRSFLEYYGLPGSVQPYWLQGLSQHIDSLKAASSAEVALQCLQRLGLDPDDWPLFVRDTLLALKGWAGMLHQAQVRPDRLPVEPVPADLMDFLAVRLILEEFALRQVLTRAGLGHLPLNRVSAHFSEPQAELPSLDCLAFQLHQVSQFLGLTPERLLQWDSEQVAGFLKAILDFSEVDRRRFLHLAYERRFRIQTLDAIHLHPPCPLPSPAEFQAVFCIDEREESTRRHLEEVAPGCQTFGTLGFFSIPMYFKALHEPHPVALCPVVIRPRHLIREVANPHAEREADRRAALRRSLGHVAHSVSSGSHTLTWGGFLTSGLGLVAAAPALFRVLFPWMAGKFQRSLRKRLLPSDTRLLIEREAQAEVNSEGLLLGFSQEEMVDIVATVLENIGLREGFAPLVMIVGHGSSSLNNPHEAAHDCGACGGGRGGPNARAFAWMANHPGVRQQLGRRGIVIPDGTRFVGAYHNTCDDDVELYDLEALEGVHLDHLEKAVAALQEARARDAQERCRRFESAAFDLSPRSALIHVEERAEDLAQPRPEYGHATNAVVVIGRRSRTRGLFLDRRPFLMSYDPDQDDGEGTILGRQLRSVVPVGAGISLEYYFSFVDNTGYGCGTKLPHNITGLIGVMDGHSSDLRTGLPLQMVEIHEPVRLLAVIETRMSVLAKILEREEGVRKLALNRWVQVAVLDPDSQEIQFLEKSGWEVHLPESRQLPETPNSREWFVNHREHLDFAELHPVQAVSC